MEGWEFVFLAYGIVWGAIVLYAVLLKRRYRKAEAELAEFGTAGGFNEDATK